MVTAAGTRPAGRPGSVVPRALRGAGPGLPLGPLVGLQAAGGLAAVAAATGSWVPGALAVVPAALLPPAVAAWLRGESLPGLLAARRALDRRRRAAARPLPPGTDPLFALAAECHPGLVGHAFEAGGGPGGRARREAGMVEDDGRLTAVLRVEAALGPLQPGLAARPLPLSLLNDALEVDGIALESAQCVQYTQPAPAPSLPERSVAGTSYALLQEGGAVPALRLTWVALRLDPELCPAAVAARGGGRAGAQRALMRAADHLASRLTGAGFRATVLSQAEMYAAVAACAGSDPAATTLIGQGDGGRPRRTAEDARTWSCDGRRHETFRVARWPALGAGRTPLAGLVALLTSAPGAGGPGLAGPAPFATTFALRLRRHGSEGVALSGHLRVTGRDEAELRAAGERVRQAARAARVKLARMERRQLPGVQATLPLGGEP
ncbi:type VII secretion protein EccE [Streptomyces sp. DSM 44917]|uniref:Type VII secretion protein EccE n=1 Tax=Streptomyces boetiae TaxID=3075541 RepID=A0ABU2LFT5_9ACTN|nr:type VII secretion protein EccE [Streptomyces sp. DSM 44917]MDT0310320.1 type VII secretion protein EccE [Streptomyces sp. DSM 44917]